VVTWSGDAAKIARSTAVVSPGRFDAQALFDAIDRRRLAERLSWAAVADQMWQDCQALGRPAAGFVYAADW
jgi:hypothetical protein